MGKFRFPPKKSFITSTTGAINAVSLMPTLKGIGLSVKPFSN